jgi:ParB/RepB/Spo0J family partition protein
MWRIQVKRRHFGFQTGTSVLAVKEYRTRRMPAKPLTFAVVAPDKFSRRWLRAELLRRFEMESIMKNAIQKQVAVPKELPPGWQFDSSQTEYYRALKPAAGIQTLSFPTKQEAILAAHSFDAANSDGLLGLAGKTIRANGAATALPVSAPATFEVHMLALDSIQRSPTNPRKVFDESKLQELAESIKLQGVVQPILVRRVTVIPNGTIHLKNRFELVAGERRWRASQIAGIATIPAIVRDLDDKATLEIQVIENLQRADLSPLEESAGYDALIKEHGYTADTLAAKIGKSKSYVYARLKINNIPEMCRAALERGDISPSVAELIGRIPNAEMRKAFWDDVEEDRYENDPYPSFRDMKDDIEIRCMRELKGAPFDQNDKKLLPEAGSCKACPKRTGNNRDLYPDGRADVCTDPKCFEAKITARNKRLISELSADGVKVATPKQSKKLIGYGGNLSYDAGREWVTLDSICHSDIGPVADDVADIDDDWEPRTYAELLGDSVKPELLVPTDAGIQRLVSREKAAEILREQHSIELDRRGSHEPSDDRKKREAERKAQEKIRTETLRQAQAKVAEDFADDFFNRHGNHDSLLRVIAKAVAVQNFNAGTNALKRRGITVKPGERDERLSEYVNKLDAADCVGLIAEIFLNAQLSGWAMWGHDKTESEILGYADVDLKEIEKAVAREQKETAKAKAKPKPNSASKRAKSAPAL